MFRVVYNGDCGHDLFGTNEAEYGLVSMLDDFISNHPRKTLLSLSETKEVSVCTAMNFSVYFFSYCNNN